jgi:hypothetical protein
VDDAANVTAVMDDNPLDEINAGHNRTADEAATTSPKEEPSTSFRGGFGNNNTALAAIQDELIKLRARMMMLETNQSNPLTRLLEQDAKP